MKIPFCSLAMLVCLLGSGAAQTAKHVEFAEYPAVARHALIEGEVQVTVNIAADGRVTSAHGASGHPLLQRAAEENVLKWIFAPSPTSQEVTEVISYSFKLDKQRTAHACTRTSFDLPAHVTVISNLPPIRIYDIPVKPRNP
jgi:TonB family protein